MSMFREAVPECTSLKVQFYGPGGSGKSWTAALLAIGLAREAGPGAKVFWIDTGEHGVDWLVALFRDAGVPLFIVKTRHVDEVAGADKDKLGAIGEAASSGAAVLVLDQATDLYHEVLEGFRRRRLEIPVGERDAIRDQMRELHEKLKAVAIHTIVVARAKDEWGDEVDAGGSRRSFRSGLRIDADAGAAYASALTILMERVPFPRGTTGDERALTVACSYCKAAPSERCRSLKVGEDGSESFGEERRAHAPRLELAEEVTHFRRATIEKDRSGKIDGRVFKNPTFRSFAPVVEALLAARATDHVVLDGSRATKEPAAVAHAKKLAALDARRDRALLWWDATVEQLGLAGNVGADKRTRRTDLYLDNFGQPCRDAILRFSPEKIEAVVDRLRAAHRFKARDAARDPNEGDLRDDFARVMERPVGLGPELVR